MSNYIQVSDSITTTTGVYPNNVSTVHDTQLHFDLDQVSYVNYNIDPNNLMGNNGALFFKDNKQMGFSSKAFGEIDAILRANGFNTLSTDFGVQGNPGSTGIYYYKDKLSCFAIAEDGTLASVNDSYTITNLTDIEKLRQMV